jgi:hypothetical protein
MQNVRSQTQPFPSWAAIAAGLLAILAAAILVLYFSGALGHSSASAGSAPVVTKSTGSELVQHNASERGVVTQPTDPGTLRTRGPR